MTMQTTPEMVVGAAVPDGWQQPRWRVIGRLVVLLWLAIAVVTTVSGERQSDWDDLQSALAEGSVSQVETDHPPLPGDWHGYSTVTLRWQGRFLHHYAEVVSVSGSEAFLSAQDETAPSLVTGDPVETLREIDPDVRITYATHESGITWNQWGWRSHGWRWMPPAAGFILGFVLIASGPQPWRATRWAWAWLFFFGGPLGVASYLLFGGPLGVGQPKDRRPFLTGGWAFLIVMIFGALLRGELTG